MTSRDICHNGWGIWPILLLCVIVPATCGMFSVISAGASAASSEQTGTAVISPAQVEVATIGDYQLQFIAGTGGIAAGGGIRVVFPKAWFTNPFPIEKVVQQEDSDRPHYVEVSCSRPGVSLSLTMSTTNFQGESERLSRPMTVTITGETLQEGDILRLAYRNTTAPYLAGRDKVVVAVDTAGNGNYRFLSGGAPYEILPGPPIEATLLGPTQAVIGHPIELQVTVFDRFYNLAKVKADKIIFSGLAKNPTKVPAASEPGRLVYKVIPESSGFCWPAVKAVVRPILPSGTLGPQVSYRASGNPLRVFRSEPAFKIYWGDMHNHSSISSDGSGKGNFRYARDVARLDFYSSSEHAEDTDDGITQKEWETIKSEVELYNKPTRFATLLGYECSLLAPSGHHNIIFRSMDGFPFSVKDAKNVATLWGLLTPGQAISIPHHTGIIWGGQPTTTPDEPGLQEVPSAPASKTKGPFVDWSAINVVMRPLLEIYSLHGSSEAYAPDDPLAYEHCHFSSSRSGEGPYYARDAWRAQQQIGVTAGGDDHDTQPGSGGLTAVVAPQLTREAVFDSLQSRQCYATTGARVYLLFDAAGISMGNVGTGTGEISGRLILAAQSDIAYAEVVRLNLTSGEYQVIGRWNNRPKLLNVTFHDIMGDSPVMYYARAELTQKIRNRVPRVWSSPVWINPASES